MPASVTMTRLWKLIKIFHFTVVLVSFRSFFEHLHRPIALYTWSFVYQAKYRHLKHVY